MVGASPQQVQWLTGEETCHLSYQGVVGVPESLILQTGTVVLGPSQPHLGECVLLTLASHSYIKIHFIVVIVVALHDGFWINVFISLVFFLMYEI